MKTHQELFNQVDICHLTSEFGGTLTYDHATWMKFYNTVAPCLREAERVKKRVPDLKDRVELLQDYDIHTVSSVSGIQHLLQDLTQSFQHTISEARFQETLDLLKQTLLILDSADANTSEQVSWLRRVHAPHVQNAAERVRELYTHLESQRVQLEETWRGIEDSVTVHLQIQRHRERAAEIEKRMKTHYEPLLQEHPSIGSTLSQAELYRTHFTTTLYEPSKELLSQATEILQDVQRLRERLGHVTPQCDVTDILARLTVALQPFTHRLQSLQDVYVSVHIFHLLFHKALTWYRKVLRFIPEGLEARAEVELAEPEEGSPAFSSSASTSGSSGILQMPVEWQVAVQSFLHKHPSPREQHLARLDTEIPPQVEKGLRVQARSLALRLRLLQRLLYSRRLSAKLLSTIFKWRAEVMSGSGSSTHSTPQPRSPKRRTFTEEASSGSSSHRQDTGVPPPKPARLFTAMRCVNSFSSSEAGDTDFVNGNWFDQIRTESVNFYGEEDVETRELSSATHLMKEDSGDIARYHKPPKMDIKILSAAQESDSCKSDCLESRTSTDELRSSGQSTAGRQLMDEERFIRLTFTPPASSASHRHSYVDDSLDSEDLAFRYPDTQTGSESGIEVAETEDPWDSIIDRIKAVSNSNLPSDVKVQCMSQLLSQSARSDPAARQRDAQSYSNPQQHKRGEDTLSRDVAGFDQFRQRITMPQDSDVRRHQSFAIAREDLRPHDRKQQESMATRNEVYTRGAAPDRWRHSVSDLDHTDIVHHRELEKPAYTVARMRHRLACSLMDLDEIDQHSSTEDAYKIVRFKNLKPDRRRKPTNRFHTHGHTSDSTVTAARSPRAVSFNHASHLRQCTPPPHHDHPRKHRAAESLTRSHEGGLDTVHLSQPQKNPSKLVAWRSHEDGLDSLERPSFLSEKPLSKALSPESGSESTRRVSSTQHVQYATSAVRGNSSRWRQGIVDDYLASPVKERRKSKDFIAPSFLKPYHSMYNLHGNADYSAPLTSLSGSRGQGRGVRGHCSDGQPGTESDSLSDGSRLGGRKSSLELDACKEKPELEITYFSFCRLSDEVDQEYMSQDEVQSSLQRSQRILMEAEDSLLLRRQRQREGIPEGNPPPEADDTLGPFCTPVKMHPDYSNHPSTSQRHCNGQEDQTGTYRAVQIQIKSPGDLKDIFGGRGTDDASGGSQDQEGVTSRIMAAAEGEFDADVSNMSDSNQDSEKRQESV
ncbi:hypothetical protein ACOMHN_060746 [Nucella lapillus]